VYPSKRIDPVTVRTANSALANLWSIHRARPAERLGTMIRHASTGLSQPVVVAVCNGLPTTFSPLGPSIGGTPLLPPDSFATGDAAISIGLGRNAHRRRKSPHRHDIDVAEE